MKCEITTVINRRSTRFEPPTEGTMEITEFEPERALNVTTHDGPMTIGGEFPGLDDSMEATIRPLMERSAATIKSLIESET